MFSRAVHGRFRPKPDWLVFGLLAEAGLFLPVTGNMRPEKQALTQH